MSEEADFEQLVVDHQPLMRGLILSLGVHPQDAADVLQQANLYVMENRLNYQPDTNFRAWIASIVRFRCMGHFRDQRRRPVIEFSEETMDRLQESYLASYDELAAKADRLEHCMNRLPISDQQVLIRYHQHGESLKQLAAQLGHTHDSLRQRVSRLRTILRACLGKDP